MFQSQNIADLVARNARRRPRHPALIEDGRALSYHETNDLAERTAAHLMALGVRQGDIVGVALKDSIDHLIVMLGVVRAGGVLLPIDVRWKSDEKLRVATSFHASKVIVEDGAEPADGIETVATDESWRQAVAVASGNRTFPSDFSHPVVLSLSSGTTGTPKGPMVTHRHLMNRLVTYAVSVGFKEHDRFLCATPMYYGGGRYMSLGYLCIGGTVINFPLPYEAEELVELVNREKATSLFLVPTLLRRLLALPDGGGLLFPNLRLLVSSGAALHVEERREVLERLSPNFINYYASTESGGVSILRPDDEGERARSVGRVVLTAEVEIAGADHDSLPCGEVGRIRYRGGTVADGFYNNPGETAEAFRDGWYYPGDLGWLDEDGYLFLAGRAKDMIIRGGVNIYPTEIEHVLLTHPAVHDAAVVGWPSKEFGEEVAAFVVPEHEAEPVDEAALIGLCEAELASYKAPRGVFFRDELPKSSLGKVLKPELVKALPEI